MLDNFFKVTKFIPKIVEKTVYDIDFNKLYEEGKRYILFDIIEDPSPSMMEVLLEKENASKISEALNILSERELEIISCRYGFCNNNVETQRQIAKRLNISRSYVSRIEKRALTKLYLYLTGEESIKNFNISE